MIRRIVIADMATYQHEPSIMEDLTKINFVYGTNGAGKTTISNFLSSPSSFSTSCSIEWENNIPLQIFTYNKAFKESYFVANNNIPGIFTLGKATNEQIREIGKKKEEQLIIKKNIIALSNSLEKKKNELTVEKNKFTEWCWSNIKAEYENSFKPLMHGTLFSKAKHSEKVFKEISKKYEGELFTIDNLKDRAETLYKSSPNSHERIKEVDSSRIIEIECHPIWEKKIIGKSDVDIASLISKLNIYDWVNQGRKYISGNSDICPFCQAHTINKEFIDKLEKLFDEQYSNNASMVEALYQEHQELSRDILSQIDNIIRTEQEDNVSKIDFEKLKNLKDLLKSAFDNVKHKMEEKKRELSRSIEITDTSLIFSDLNKLIIIANNIIEDHNRQVQNIVEERKKLYYDFWHYVRNDNKTYFDQYQERVTKYEDVISNIKDKLVAQQNDYEELEKEIKKANKNITNVQSSVDDINKMLNLYGFNNFRIVSAGNNQYQIQRDNGEIANSTLSEGEVTFITFLYFMQLVMGGKTAEDAQSDRVVVIDDPISSLDSMVLYVVSAIVKSLIRNIKKGSHVKQLIILTHNIFFHKEISFVDGREKERKDYSFWIVAKKDGISKIYSYKQKNPVKSSYEMLWEDIKNWKNVSASSLQNTMRRIYETYFKVLGRMSDSSILESINNLEERNICLSLIGWINDGSHTIPDDYYIVPSDDERERYLSVFRKIFERMGHIDHYNMMMGIKGIGAIN